MSDLKYLFTDYLAPTIFGLKQNVRFCVRVCVCVRFNQFRSSVSFSDRLSDGEHTRKRPGSHLQGQGRALTPGLPLAVT